MNNKTKHETEQPVTRDRHIKDYPDVNERNLTANPGDVIADEPQTIEEKAQQVAVDAPDITGDWILILTYLNGTEITWIKRPV